MSSAAFFTRSGSGGLLALPHGQKDQERWMFRVKAGHAKAARTVQLKTFLKGYQQGCSSAARTCLAGESSSVYSHYKEKGLQSCFRKCQGQWDKQDEDFAGRY